MSKRKTEQQTEDQWDDQAAKEAIAAGSLKGFGKPAQPPAVKGTFGRPITEITDTMRDAVQFAASAEDSVRDYLARKKAEFHRLGRKKPPRFSRREN